MKRAYRLAALALATVDMLATVTLVVVQAAVEIARSTPEPTRTPDPAAEIDREFGPEWRDTVN